MHKYIDTTHCVWFCCLCVYSSKDDSQQGSLSLGRSNSPSPSRRDRMKNSLHPFVHWTLTHMAISCKALVSSLAVTKIPEEKKKGQAKGGGGGAWLTTVAIKLFTKGMKAAVTLHLETGSREQIRQEVGPCYNALRPTQNGPFPLPQASLYHLKFPHSAISWAQETFIFKPQPAYHISVSYPQAPQPQPRATHSDIFLSFLSASTKHRVTC